jgi:hypothetical protein
MFRLPRGVLDAETAGNLSASLQAIVDFFEIDEDLIAVAAASSPSIQEPEGMAGWVASLRDLQALADRQEDPAAFRKRFLELRAQHQRKPSLLDRFDQAGLPS